MADLDTAIPMSLKTALDAEVARTKRSLSSVVTAALAQYLEKPIHTVFQVSTSGALVAGVYDREVSVQGILEHGNFGLGTFANLDGEMVVVDGRVYQVKGSGQVLEASADAGAPFAVVTWFEPENDVSISPVGSFNDLQARCDEFRLSGNTSMHLDSMDTSSARGLAPSTRPGLELASSTPPKPRANSTSPISRELWSGSGRPGFPAPSA
jgi:acetolactate decarboxylase